MSSSKYLLQLHGMEVVIQGTINQLGFYENGEYFPEPDCQESIRDLIRFLRGDGPDLLVRLCCGEHNVVQSDLIPILKTPDLKDEMFDLTLRLAANLCQPAMMSLQGKTPENKEQYAVLRKLEENLTRAKMACGDTALFRVLKGKLSKFFIETEWDDRSEEDRLVMERIVVFIRYMFAIQPVDVDDKRTTFDGSTHDRLVEAAIDAGLDATLMDISRERRESEFHLSILEIFALMLKEHKPGDLVSAGKGRSEEERKKNESELARVVETQRAAVDAMRRKIMSTRHTNFAGSYVVRGVRAVNGANDVIINKPVKDVVGLDFGETRKSKRRTPKNRRPFEDGTRTFLSSIEIRMKMKGFVIRLLDECYNRLMRATREKAFKARSATETAVRAADLHYFLLERFCLEFARLSEMPSEKVGATLGVEAFHHVQMQMDNFLETAKIEKKKGRSYGLRAQFALSAYKEMIIFHQHMLERGTPDEKEAALSTCKHILRMEEYRDLSCNILRGFMPGVLSKTFLRELVLANHAYFRLLEKSVKSGVLATVSKKQRVRKMRPLKRKNEKGLIGEDADDDNLGYEEKRDKEREEAARFDSLSPVDVEEMWEERLQAQAKEILVGDVEKNDDARAMNTLLTAEDEEHQRFAMLYIQRALRGEKMADAIGIYHAAREIWSGEGVFGRSNMPLEDELNELKAIAVTDLTEVAASLAVAEKKADDELGGGRKGVDDYEGEEGYDSEEEDDNRYEHTEVAFDMKQFTMQFARNDVLKWYILLLGEFATNSVELNHALVKMLHRIAFDVGFPPKIWMVSLFAVLDRVRGHVASYTKEELKKSAFYELYQFGHHVLKKFFGSWEKLGDRMWAECLFWKTPQVAYEMVEGWGSTQTDGENAKTWTEDLEEELRGHADDYMAMDERPEGMDIADYIENSLSRPRTRRQILRKMKDLALDTMGASFSKGSIKDRLFPIVELKRVAGEFEGDQIHRQEGDDLPTYCSRRLVDAGCGEFTKARIVKQLAYLGIEWAPVRKQPKLKEWSEGLQTELAALKEQYDEEDDDEKSKVDVASYVHRRLSEKRPRGEVERYLEKMGVHVEKREKAPRKPRTKKDELREEEERDEEELADLSFDDGEEEEAKSTTDEDGEGGDDGAESAASSSSKKTEKTRKKEKKEKKKKRARIEEDESGDEEEKEELSRKERKKERKEKEREEKKEKKSKEPKRSALLEMVAEAPSSARKRRAALLDSDEEDEADKMGEFRPRSSSTASIGAASEKSREATEERESSLERKVKRARVESEGEEEDKEEGERGNVTGKQSEEAKNPKRALVLSSSDEEGGEKENDTQKAPAPSTAHKLADVHPVQRRAAIVSDSDDD